MTTGNMLRVDFSEVQEFDLIPEGVYRACVTEQEVRESNSSEYPYINWTYTIVGSANDNRKVWLMTSLSPKALFRLKAFLIAAGETKESLASDFEMDPDKYVGKEMSIQIKHEKDTRQGREGKLQDRVGDVYAVGMIAEGLKSETQGKNAPAPAPSEKTKSGAKRL